MGTFTVPLNLEQFHKNFVLNGRFGVDCVNIEKINKIFKHKHKTQRTIKDSGTANK